MKPFDAEWEWSFQTPLLLQPTFAPLPSPIAEFLGTPLSEFKLEKATLRLETRLGDLKTTRIGFRFERILEALFSSHPAVHSLRSGIIIPARTEIDLLHGLAGLPKTWIHWEVAVKFYLALDAAGSESPDRWIGPTLRDTLGIKTRAISTRQLRVLEDPEVRTFVGIPDGDTVLASPYVKGILFLPWRNLARESLHPREVRADGQRGYWVEESELLEFLRTLEERTPGGKTLLFADRKDWIRSHQPNEESVLDFKSFFNIRLSRPTRADLEANLKFPPFQGTFLTGENTGDGSNEIRFFCVPDGWRDSAERALESLKQMSRIKG